MGNKDFISPEEYKLIKNFSPNEFASPYEMNFYHLRRLDSFRDYIGSRIVITSSNSKSNKDNVSRNDTSTHYQGLATDIIAPWYEGSLFDLYLAAEKFGFTGIGIYPDWTFRDSRVGGLHLDSRVTIQCKGARWIGRKKIKGVGNDYYPLTQDTLHAHGIIGVVKR